MSNRNGPLIAALLLTGAAQCAVAESALSLSDRVTRLEQSGGSGTAVELLTQIEQMQMEVQELRGLVEEQANLIEQLQRRQRDQYVDLDNRLQQQLLSGGGPRPQTSGYPVETMGLPVQGTTEGPVETPVIRQSPAWQEAPEVTPANDSTAATEGLGISTVYQPEVVLDPVAEKQAYEGAFADLKDGHYADSARKFATFVGRYPNSQYSDNAQYWLGESYYVTRNYRIALESFQTLINHYPNSPKVADAMLKIGYTYYELKKWDEARSTLTQVTESYPGTTVARLAQSRLKALRLK